MAKQKYERKIVIDATGTLDEKEGRYILSIDGTDYDLIEDILKPSLGTEIHFKSDSFEV